MTADSDILTKWYVGELGGHALFLQLVVDATPQAASKWAALGRVEQGVAFALADALEKRRICVPVAQNLESRARTRCAAVTGKSWIETMHWFRTIAADALQRMTADALVLSPDLASVGDLMVRHERALLSFAELELAGRGSESLVIIEEFLDGMSK
jgi:hypothetical protein